MSATAVLDHWTAALDVETGMGFGCAGSTMGALAGVGAGGVGVTGSGDSFIMATMPSAT